ncbi:hypothetical protein EIP86_001633 [Pleurotus ostreatoroseus]|nr:hypothetical protein EIP86_001633 [Pleurotus ostreatoroseus]
MKRPIPLDVLCTIAKQICDKSDLANLSLANHSTLFAARPSLFNDILILVKTKNRSPEDIVEFFQENPSLAGMVHTLTLLGVGWLPDGFPTINAHECMNIFRSFPSLHTAHLKKLIWSPPLQLFSPPARPTSLRHLWLDQLWQTENGYSVFCLASLSPKWSSITINLVQHTGNAEHTPDRVDVERIVVDHLPSPSGVHMFDEDLCGTIKWWTVASDALRRCTRLSTLFFEVAFNSWSTTVPHASLFSRGTQLETLRAFIDALPSATLLIHIKFLFKFIDVEVDFNDLWDRVPWSTLHAACAILHSTGLLAVAVGILPANGEDAEESDTVLGLSSDRCSDGRQLLQSGTAVVGCGAFIRAIADRLTAHAVLSRPCGRLILGGQIRFAR